jgi:hypothetical protein
LTTRIRDRLPLLGALVGALLALADGISSLGCAPTPAIVTTVAGSFGAGAALTGVIVQARRRRAGPD